MGTTVDDSTPLTWRDIPWTSKPLPRLESVDPLMLTAGELLSYRRGTPAPPKAKQLADRQLSNLTWAQNYQQHFRVREMHERQARIESEVARELPDQPNSLANCRRRLAQAVK